MTNKDIEQLINKYLDGETSPAEECQLARELQHADIPEEWQAIRLMLGELTLGEAEYDALLAERTAPLRLPRGGKKKGLPSGQLPVGSGAIGERKRRRPEGLGVGRWLFGIAASVLLLLVFRFGQEPIEKQPVVAETVEQSIPQPATQPIVEEKEEEALPEVKPAIKPAKKHRKAVIKPEAPAEPMFAEAEPMPQPEEEAPVIPPEKQALADIFLAEEALQVAYELRAQQEAIRAYAASLTGEEPAKAIIAF